MASPIWWMWVWVNSGSWWWTGRPGVLQSMVLSDWSELNWLHKYFYYGVYWTLFQLLFAIFLISLFIYFYKVRQYTNSDQEISIWTKKQIAVNWIKSFTCNCLLQAMLCSIFHQAQNLAYFHVIHTHTQLLYYISRCADSIYCYLLSCQIGKAIAFVRWQTLAPLLILNNSISKIPDFFSILCSKLKLCLLVRRIYTLCSVNQSL